MHDTRNYWISNKGRLINNFHGYLYVHKTDKERKTKKVYEALLKLDVKPY